MTEEIDISEYDLSDYEMEVLIRSYDAYASEPEGTTLRIPGNTDMGTFNVLVAKGIMRKNAGRPDIFLSPTGIKLREILRKAKGLHVAEAEED